MPQARGSRIVDGLKYNHRHRSPRISQEIEVPSVVYLRIPPARPCPDGAAGRARHGRCIGPEMASSGFAHLARRDRGDAIRPCERLVEGKAPALEVHQAFGPLFDALVIEPTPVRYRRARSTSSSENAPACMARICSVIAPITRSAWCGRVPALTRKSPGTTSAESVMPPPIE